MGQLQRLFPRQTLIFTANGDEYYSEIFDMTNTPTATIDARIYYQSDNTATITVTVQSTSDPTLSNWVTTSFTDALTGYSDQGTIAATGLLRFMRVHLSADKATNATLGVEGVASS